MPASCKKRRRGNFIIAPSQCVGWVERAGWAKAAKALLKLHGRGSAFAHAVQPRKSDRVGKIAGQASQKYDGRCGRFCPPYQFYATAICAVVVPSPSTVVRRRSRTSPPPPYPRAHSIF